MSKWPDGVPIPEPVKPEGIADWEWDLYLDDNPTKHSALRSKYPHLRAKVERAMGWKDKDIADAEEIAGKVGGIVASLDRETPAILARLRAALRLLENEHITPQGKRILEKILDEEERRA